IVESYENAIAQLVRGVVPEWRATTDRDRLIEHDRLVDRQDARRAAGIALAGAEIVGAVNVLARKQIVEPRRCARRTSTQRVGECEDAGQRIRVLEHLAGYCREDRRETERHGVAGLVGRVEQVPQNLADRELREPAL